jgi:gamma-glutamylcyclotransferase (GGCT)/AIG2-like uncharacterized protein YtfP
VVRPRDGAAVEGRIMEDVGAGALAALDAYEGHEYRRVTARVRTPDGQTIDAYIYVPAEATMPSPRGARRGEGW